MPMITFVFGVVLIVVGIVFNAIADTTHHTPLIPAFFGAAFILCAAAAIKPKWRMHAMHVAVLLAVLLVIGSIMPLLNPTALKVSEGLLTIGLGVVYIVMCVRSFFAARRARKAEAKPTA